MHARALIAPTFLLVAAAGSAQDYLAIERAEAVLEKSTDPRERRETVKKVAALRSPKAIPLLVATLRPRGRDPREDWFVRKTAVSALVAIGAPAADAVRSLARDPSTEVRLSALEVLDALDAQGLAELLATRIEDEPDPTLRSTCIGMLARVKGADLASIVRASKEDPDERVRERAKAILADRKAAAVTGR